MTDLEVLLLVLIGLYLSHTGHWYGGDAELFRAAARAWTRATALAGFRGGKLKVVFADLLPPLHGIAIVPALPFRIAPAGICLASGEVVAHDAADFRAVERKLYSADRLLCELRTEQLAQDWCERLQAIAASKRREDKLRSALRGIFDAEFVRDRRDHFARATRWLRRLCNLMFFWLFVVGPASINLLGLGITWIPLLAGVVLLLAFIVRGFVRAHRALYPAERGARFRQTLGMALSPPAAARATDLLTLDLFAGTHALAVASVVFSADDFRRYAGELLRRMKYPLAEDLSEEAAAIAAWHARELLGAAEAFAARAGVDLAQVYAVPESQPDAVSYCPRCHEQYINEAATCADCPGVPLARYHAPALAAN